MSLYSQAKAEIESLKAECNALVVDGITFADIQRIIGLSIKKAHDIFHAIPGATEEEQDLAVRQAVREMFNETLRPKDIPGVPASWEPVVDDALENGLDHAISIALGAIRAATR